MITISNAELANFLDPALNELLNDKTRRFPTADVFKISDLLDQIQMKVRVYQKCAKTIMEDCGGTLDEKGVMSFRAIADKQKAEKEIDNLNRESVEIQGDLIPWKKSWPDLTIREAVILRPIIKL